MTSGKRKPVNWLQDTLEDAVRENIQPCLCCWRNGGRSFEQRIRTAIPDPAGADCRTGPWSGAEIITLATALSELEWREAPRLLDRPLLNSRDNPGYLFLGARQLVKFIWRATPPDTLRRDVDPILLPSPIGFLLQRHWKKAEKAAEQAYLTTTAQVRRTQKAELNKKAHAQRQAWYRERDDLDRQALKWVRDNAHQFDQFLSISQGYAVSHEQSALTPSAKAWVVPMQTERWGELYVLCLRPGEQTDPRTFLAEVFASRELAEKAIAKPRRVSRQPGAGAAAGA